MSQRPPIHIDRRDAAPPDLWAWLAAVGHPYLLGAAWPLELLDAHRRRLAASLVAVLVGPGAALWAGSTGTLPEPLAWGLGVCAGLWGGVGCAFALLPLRTARTMEREGAAHAGALGRAVDLATDLAADGYRAHVAHIYPGARDAPDPVPADPAVEINGDSPQVRALKAHIRALQAAAPAIPGPRPVAQLEPPGEPGLDTVLAATTYDEEGLRLLVSRFLADLPLNRKALAEGPAPLLTRDAHTAALTQLRAWGVLVPVRNQADGLGPLGKSWRGRLTIAAAHGADGAAVAEQIHQENIARLAAQPVPTTYAPVGR